MKTKSRKNVTATRDSVSGLYLLSGIDGQCAVYLSTGVWRKLGLRPLAKGVTALVDLQVSGIPRKPKTKRSRR